MFGRRKASQEGTANSAEVGTSLQTQLADRMSGMFDAVVEERRAHFAARPDEASGGQSAALIIGSYANRNALISGGASLVPGPWGMLAVLPEVALIVRNQLAMIHDIARSHGKDGHLTRELMAGILLTGLGGSAGALLTMQGGKVFVRRAALRAFQQIVALLAGKVTQQMLRSTISKYLPLLGAAAMAAWSKYMTHQVGRKATQIFQMEIEVVDGVVEDAEIVAYGGATDTDQQADDARGSTSNVEAAHVRALINLVKVDGSVAPEEEAYVRAILEGAELSGDEQVELSRALKCTGPVEVDYAALSDQPAIAIGLLVDLVALAQRDGTIHPAERLYIQRTGKLLGFADSEIADLMP